MTRYKRYLQSKGFKLECEMPYMPITVGNILLESIIPGVDLISKCVTIKHIYVVGDHTTKYYADGRKEIDFD